VIEPEIGQDFLKLALAVNGAQYLLLCELEERTELPVAAAAPACARLASGESGPALCWR